MSHRARAGTLALLVLSVGASGLPAVMAQEPTEAARRLARVRTEIGRLEAELERLAGKERGLLGELERLGGELRLRQAEFDETALRLEQVEQAIVEHDRSLTELVVDQDERRSYLQFRLRGVYKSGPDQVLRRFISGGAADDYWSGANYAALLSERDAAVLGDYRTDAARIRRERQALDASRAELAGLHEESRLRRDRLAAARRQRGGALRRAREDQDTRRTALGELYAAAEQLSAFVGSLEPDRAAATLDVRKFQGLLDRPSTGKISAGFGTTVHPRFQTEVPHPGWDIDAPLGTNIVAVFDGRILYADWMRGYGLTVIVDHGNEVLSIYAHASVLVVQKGDQVRRGQLIGQVGDTGSLRGSFLYFELRVDGRPTDPRPWIRP